MPRDVSTSATTDLLRTTSPKTAETRITYETARDSRVTYSVEPHPPTPRPQH